MYWSIFGFIPDLAILEQNVCRHTCGVIGGMNGIEHLLVLLADTPTGAEASATAYTIVEMARKILFTGFYSWFFQTV